MSTEWIVVSAMAAWVLGMFITLYFVAKRGIDRMSAPPLEPEPLKAEDYDYHPDYAAWRAMRAVESEILYGQAAKRSGRVAEVSDDARR